MISQLPRFRRSIRRPWGSVRAKRGSFVQPPRRVTVSANRSKAHSAVARSPKMATKGGANASSGSGRPESSAMARPSSLNERYGKLGSQAQV